MIVQKSKNEVPRLSSPYEVGSGRAESAGAAQTSSDCGGCGASGGSPRSTASIAAYSAHIAAHLPPRNLLISSKVILDKIRSQKVRAY